MDNTNRFDLVFETLTELAEEDQADRTQLRPALPSLKSTLANIGPLPTEALVLGIAEDRFPVLLNLYDPVPGPILILGDKHSGKTRLLQTIASAAEYLHTPTKLQYGVVTPDVNQWTHLQKSTINAGIYSTDDHATSELLQSLVTWAHNNKGNEQSILLLIDNLEEVLKLNDETKQNFRWLLSRGPNRRVWPIVTLDTNFSQELISWMEFFHTRFFGQIQDTEKADFITGSHNVPLQHLAAGSQFCMLEGKNWLKFWIPSIE